MADAQHCQTAQVKAPLSLDEETEIAVPSKEELVAALQYQSGQCDCDAIKSDAKESMVLLQRQSKVNQSHHRSQPGAFRVLTLSQAQSQRNNDNSTEMIRASSAHDDDEPMAGLTVVATVVDTSRDGSDTTSTTAAATAAAKVSTTSEVYTAVPLETIATPSTRLVYWSIVVATLLVVAVASLAVALALKQQRQHVPAGMTPNDGGGNITIKEHSDDIIMTQNFDLFAPYNRVTAHMALIFAHLPPSCRPRQPPLQIQVECTDHDTTNTAILYIYQEVSSHVRLCNYSDDRKRAICDLDKSQTGFSYVVYSCGFRSSDDTTSPSASSSIALVEHSVGCSDLTRPTASDLEPSKESMIHIALELGRLCLDNQNGLDYQSVPTECRDRNNAPQEHLNSNATGTCIEVRSSDECLLNDCLVGAGSIQDNGTKCESPSWEESVFGPKLFEETMKSLSAIANANSEFAIDRAD